MVGSDIPVRVNCNVGINVEADRTYEIKRLEAVKNSDCQPDIFMNLSIGQFNISGRRTYSCSRFHFQRVA